jgi:1-acyl-sn-glycerol-3-phosphate acyltransferase
VIDRFSAPPCQARRSSVLFGQGPVRGIFSAVALALLRTNVNRRDTTARALQAGPAVLSCNHVSLLDGVLIALASPVPIAVTSETMFSRKTWWSRVVFALLSQMGYGWVIPLDAQSPMGMRQALRALRNGHCVLLFPQGRIVEAGAAAPDKPGAQWLARRSDCPLVKLRIDGAQRSRIFAKRGDQWWPSIDIYF